MERRVGEPQCFTELVVNTFVYPYVYIYIYIFHQSIF